jgi:hypothetical protein
MYVTIEANMKPLSDALNEYMRYTSKSLPEVLQKRAAMLISGGKGVKGLYQEARSQAPDVKADIRALPTKLNWRIKRKSGSAMKEIRRRLGYAGLVQSTGWFNTRYGTPRKDGSKMLRQVANPRGRVIENLSGPSPYIMLINRTLRAGEYAQRTGYIDRAIAGAAEDMRDYIKQKILKNFRKLSI